MSKALKSRGTNRFFNFDRTRILRIESLEDRRMLSARAVEATNSFASDVYEHLQNEDGNLFFSPLSITTALAMTYAGAGGQTAAEMEQVLHLGAEPGIHDSFNQLLTFIEQVDLLGDYELTTANAIWPRIGLPVGQDFLDTIENDYGSHVQSLDYSDLEAAEATINNWVWLHTRLQIQNLVDDLDPDIRMVLTNAVYFRGQWDFPFDPRFTHTTDFHLDDGQTTQTQMMLAQPTTAHTVIDGFRILDLPMADGRASMVLMLPNTSSSGEVTAELLDDIDTWLESSPPVTFLNVSVPKFQTTVSTGLNNLLDGLGMPTAFTAGADFSGIADGLFIDRVIHKANIEVNEQGTEAAAATEVDFVLCFVAGTPVLTPEGEKPIEQLAIGDYVLARDDTDDEGELQPKVVEKTLHGHADIVELHVGGQVIRTTDAHPFFVQGKGWTSAIKLQPKDKLSTNHRDWVEVEQVLQTETAEPVYNLRVTDHRTYFIGRKSWGFAVWAHNDYGNEFVADRPFHFMIRDNATSTISFMGRIEDPSQLQNNLNPTVEQASADFDTDGDIDGNDFLSWQLGYGDSYGTDDLTSWEASFAPSTSADFDNDNDVDGSDFLASQRDYDAAYDSELADGLGMAFWAAAYGQPLALLSDSLASHAEFSSLEKTPSTINSNATLFDIAIAYEPAVQASTVTTLISDETGSSGSKQSSHAEAWLSDELLEQAFK